MNIETMPHEEILMGVYESTKQFTNEDKASAYGINFVDGNFVVTHLGSDSDIYDLIHDLDSDKLQHNYDYTSFITYGWAAPLNQDGEIDGAPSIHPERRRIRLLITASKKEEKVLGSALKFSDDEEVIYDLGNASGSLADVINNIMAA